MQYISHYVSPLGKLLLAADDIGLTGVWFEGQAFFAHGLEEYHIEAEIPILVQAKQWLETYFCGKVPHISVPVHLIGTDFQKEIWEMLSEIPYGKTVTYGELASRCAAKRGVARFSAQAVGSAVGKNPISLIIPCHRVVGANGALTGYAGGLDRKAALLHLEQGGQP